MHYAWLFLVLKFDIETRPLSLQNVADVCIGDLDARITLGQPHIFAIDAREKMGSYSDGGKRNIL